MKEGCCYCGNVQIKFCESNVILALHCHCVDCQKYFGAKASVLTMPSKTLEIFGKTCTAEVIGGSGKKVIRHFCGECGTVIFNVPEFRPGYINLMVSTLNDSSWVKFDFSIWTKFAPTWAKPSTDIVFPGAIPSEVLKTLPF